MKHIAILAIAAAAAGSATLAFAADVPGNRPALAPAPAYAPPLFTWTGFYVGLNAGYGFGQSNTASYRGNAAYLGQFPNVPQSYKLKRSGFVGGATAGYNVQSGGFVYGIEGDVDFATGSKSQTVVAPFATGTAKNQLGAFGTLRARAGLLVTDRWLAYATGGLIVGQTKLSSTLVGTGGTFVVGGVPGTWSGSNTKTKAGWTLGAGAEYAISNNITAKLEYLYYNLGRSTLAVAPTNAVATASVFRPSLRQSNNGSIVRAGLNYKF